MGKNRNTNGRSYGCNSNSDTYRALGLAVNKHFMISINDIIKTIQEHYATTSRSITFSREVIDKAKEHSALLRNCTPEATAAYIARATKSFYVLNDSTLILRKRP